jgi:UDP-N-acetylmuramate--alanine ligase
MKLSETQTIHFIGIGGIGASALAQILNAKGKTISGSDQSESEITNRLSQSGINISIGHDTKNLPSNCELVIYSHAVPENNPEILEAKKLGLTSLTYPQALSLLTKEYFTIAITGTHGKSTTTAMTALTLIDAGLDPTVVVGTKLKEFDNQNFRVGESQYLVIEACEYKSSFLTLEPNILAITNIEADHLDHFKTAENYKNTFAEYVNKLPSEAKIIFNAKDEVVSSILEGAKATLLPWDKLIEFELEVPGEFNKENASFAKTISLELGVPVETMKSALQKFKGTWRRQEYKKVDGLTPIFIDDYGHHPTEVRLTLDAIAQKHPGAKILCVFQPHQYSRTFNLLHEFGESFGAATKVIIPNIYQVRDSEEDVASVSPQDLVDEINKNGVKAENGQSLEKTAELIKENHKEFDIIITMGAGNITSIYELL